MKRIHKGVSLTELLVVLAVSGTLLVVAAKVLRSGQLLLRFTDQMLVDERTSDRLSEFFRRDVALAEHAQIDEEKSVLSLRTSAAGEVQYQLQDGQLWRTATDSEGEIAREQFAFSEAVLVEFEIEEEPRRVRTVVRLLGARPELAEEAPRILTRLVVVPGTRLIPQTEEPVQ